MSRSYKSVFPKKYWVYSVEDLMRLYSVSANTVSNWVQDRLVPSDAQKPYIFQGAAVQRFHKQRRAQSAAKLRPGQFLCFGCKALVFPDIETVRDIHASNEKHLYEARSPDCSLRVWKVSNEADRFTVEDCRNPNTTRVRTRSHFKART